MPTLVRKRASLIEVPCAPERKLLFGDSVLAVCNVVLNVGAQAPRAAAMLRSSTRGVICATWMPRLFSSASLTASSAVSCRTCGACAAGVV
jgi:hypothetical protein